MFEARLDQKTHVMLMFYTLMFVFITTKKSVWSNLIDNVLVHIRTTESGISPPSCQSTWLWNTFVSRVWLIWKKTSWRSSHDVRESLLFWVLVYLLEVELIQDEWTGLDEEDPVNTWQDSSCLFLNCWSKLIAFFSFILSNTWEGWGGGETKVIREWRREEVYTKGSRDTHT